MHYQEIAKIAQQAWDKTKDKSDPVWNDCDSHHRQVFIATATGVINSGHAVNDFEHAVKKLANVEARAVKAIAEVQAENPTAHSDEIAGNGVPNFRPLPLHKSRARLFLACPLKWRQTALQAMSRCPPNQSAFTGE
jgi:hypothetical protein